MTSPTRQSPLTFNNVVDTLRRLGCDPEERRGEYMAHCPGHDDNRKSLSVSRGDDKPVVWYCHAGCSQADVMDILLGKRAPVQRSGRGSSRRRASSGRVYSPTTWYDYCDEEGNLLYQHGRTRDKQFPFRMPDGRWGLDDVVRRVPYRLHELDSARDGHFVFIVEGEKDADRLASLGCVATCNDNGAGKWDESFARYFEGLHVAILPDNDGPGRAHAQNVAANVSTYAESIKIVELSGLPEKGDVSDWLDAGHDIGALMLECYQAPIWEPEEDEADEERPAGNHRQYVADRLAAREDRWPAPPASDTAGFVATLRMGKTSLAPIYPSEGSFQENPLKRHKWIVRHGNQVLQEAQDADVFMLEIDEDEYTRFKDRLTYRRNKGERREWWAVPQESVVVVFHTDGEEGGYPVNTDKVALYRFIDGLIDGLPDGRNAKGTQDWGKRYRTSRGDGTAKSDQSVLTQATWAVALAQSKGEIKPFHGMKKMTVKQIKDAAGEAIRPALLAMLEDELRNMQRKTVITTLMKRLRMNAVQLWSKCSIRKAAQALGIRLDKISLRGATRISPEEAYKRLIGAGIEFFTRTGRDALHVFLDWLTFNEEPDSHYSEQDPEPIFTPVQNNGKNRPSRPPDPYFGKQPEALGLFAGGLL